MPFFSGSLSDSVAFTFDPPVTLRPLEKTSHLLRSLAKFVRSAYPGSEGRLKGARYYAVSRTLNLLYSLRLAASSYPIPLIRHLELSFPSSALIFLISFSCILSRKHHALPTERQSY